MQMPLHRLQSHYQASPSNRWLGHRVRLECNNRTSTQSFSSHNGFVSASLGQEDKVVTSFIAGELNAVDLWSRASPPYIPETLLPTKHGLFRLRGYKHSLDGGLTFTEPTAIISGSVEGKSDVPVRVHDACYTSEVLGSLKCDCADQLALALKMINDSPPGMVIYLQQEGRGIGLANKIAAYSLQEQGLDTVDANRALGLPDDCREYTAVRNILSNLGIKSIRLIVSLSLFLPLCTSDLDVPHRLTILGK